LDISISRLPDRLIFKLYQKPTPTGRIIHYAAVQPFSVKFNTAVNLRNYYLSSSDLIFHTDIQKLFSDTLHGNGYPAKFIDSVSHFHPTPEIPISKPKYFFIPFIGPSSTIIKKLLCSLDPKICIDFTKHNTVQQKYFSKTKDAIPNSQSGVVYKVPCSDCPGVYIGKTSQHLKKRMSQHQYDVKKEYVCTKRFQNVVLAVRIMYEK